jgi:hypothetical protein
VKKESVQQVLRNLDQGGVRYLVAGGLAVNAHGVLRFTADMDLVVQLEPENIRKTFSILGSLGYKPIVPVTAEAFADRKTRLKWVKEKGMRVLEFYSDAHKETCVDIFAEEPFEFDAEYPKALVKGLGEVNVRFVSLESLLGMKRSAGRPKDLADIDDLSRKEKP